MKRHKNNKTLTLAMAFVLGCLTSLPAFAEEANVRGELAFDLEGITVEAARPDWETKLSPGSVTVIRPDDYKGEQKTLPDLMRKVPGVHVREVNGKGQYTTVTVRGSTAAQVGVFIDGVLSNLGGDSAADLSTIPVANVERIEVYRGYIPARFAGTYIGGVINIVTKKPEKADVSVELGKSSYGGKKGAVEVTAPLGDGSLMFGTNYESSDGDFKYKNYAAEINAVGTEADIAANQNNIDNFHAKKIDEYKNTLGWDEATANYYKNNLVNWKAYVNDSNGFAKDYLNNNTTATKADIDEYIKDINPETSSTMDNYRKQLADAKKKLAQEKNANRWRKYNDYENINSILKWQNDEWMVKAAWNKIDRHLPDSLWDTSPLYAPTINGVDLKDMYYYDSRRQKIDTKELLLQNRHNVGKMEWGWMLDYTKSDKEYRAEHIDDSHKEDHTVPLRHWSKYESDKYNAQIDGTYKLSDNNMLDFQVNYSHEKMDVDGSGLNDPDRFIDETNWNSVYGQMRNRYEQDMLNIQLQDTITIDKKASWFLTPSVKYNRSTITGYSNADRFVGGTGNYKWVSPKDEQTDDKVTWQLALKKEFDSNFTMRMTGGTYYRLLNMYEIAGDGAGILPAPNVNGLRESAFPVPEEGKQFDISGIWNGNTLGAFNKTTLTYFWRDSDNMLQLQRYGKDYWCYLNDSKGTARGIELQSSFNWNKLDLDLQATYTKTDAQRRKSTFDGSGYPYLDVYQTYQPEWEGNARLTYNPQSDLALFVEAHYTDSYYTNSVDVEDFALPVEDLLVFNAGVKFKTRNNWQFTLGCNDMLNEGPKLRIRDLNNRGYVNPEHPIQGRTFYVTAKYDF
ncbi:MAG: TonB-dependent receptor plug domain-containing protein [Phascolarctobacterium sp.]|nr:TonB-dependent receptor plug domain-containing protein [Phascolarctobacterium sp.]